MIDITATMNNYRECARHLWNTYCLKVMEPNDWDFRDRINTIEVELFRALVLYKLGREDTVIHPAQWYPPEILSFIKLEASQSSGTIKVNREEHERSRNWDDPIDCFANSELDLRFIHYFDWDVLGFRDFAYYKVRIVGSEKYPHIVGREALLPVDSTISVFYDDKG
jgi:hypothetical protein